MALGSFVVSDRTSDRASDRESLFNWTFWLCGFLSYWDVYEGKKKKVPF